MYGADVTVGELIGWNLIPSTIGNIIGGAFGIALPYWFLFDPTSKELELMSNFNKYFHQHLDRKSTFAASSDGEGGKEDEIKTNSTIENTVTRSKTAT